MATSSFVLAAALLAVLLAVQVSGNDPVCSLPKEPGTCTGRILRFYYNATLKRCLPFRYGGCGGNGNNFKEIMSCAKTCNVTLRIRPKSACSMPMLKGPCTGNIKRYYYNATTKRCLPFAYGGCKGNANNFRTVQECARFCGVAPKPRPKTACSMPMLKGPCTGNIKRYYYNATTKRCLPFAYGGCKGNANNFRTVQECARFCGVAPKPRPKTACSMPVLKGPCTGNIKRYYYNAATKSCLPFAYGGCKGNANNFRTVQECARFCGVAPKLRPKTACSMPMLKGPCTGNIKRYYYNAAMKRCLPFAYGGCKGNANNFRTKLACEKFCGVAP